MKKRILSMLLLLVMLVTAVPFAATEAAAAETPKTGVAETYVDLDTLYVKEGLASHFSVFGKNASSVNLTAGTWTDLVAGKTASFSYDGTNRWKVNADGSVGYTTFYGVVGSDGVVVKNAETDNYKKTSNRLQLGLSLLPNGDFSVEYFAKYKPVYVYDANTSDKIARAADGSLMETDDYMTRDFVYDNLQVEHPIIQLGWYTGITSILDSTSHWWEKENKLQRGSIHWFFDCPEWYYQSSSHQRWYVGGGTANVPSAGLNDPTDAWAKNNAINTYGIYVDETVTNNGDDTRTTSAVFSLYRNAKLYNSNASKPNSTANAEGGTYYYDADTAFTSGKHNFWLSATHATDFFDVRIYNRVLTDAEKKQNHAVDVLNYYGIKLTEEYVNDTTVLARVFDIVADEELYTDPLAYLSKATEVQNKVESCLPEFDGLNELYVKDGIVALYTAFKGDGEYLTQNGSNIIWQNRLNGASDATFEKAGWIYNTERGGVGYTQVYGQLNADGSFTKNYAGANYSNGNRLRLDLALLPKTDFTLEYAARYDLTYVYDAANDELIPADDAGTSDALPPNEIVGQPVDVIGFLSSYTGKRGCYWKDANGVGALRWRSVDKGGYKGWDNNYGMNGLDLTTPGIRDIGSYTITRDESTSGEGDALVTSAVYTFYHNGVIPKDKNNYDAVIQATTAKEVGPGKYYHQDDDTEFYLSYKLGTTFYSLRLYNRVLSAAEQNRNRGVDLLRYYDITLPKEVLEDADVVSAVCTAAATQSFAYDPLEYAVAKATLQSVVSAVMHRDTLADKFARSEHLTAVYTVYAPETVNLTTGKWTDLVSGKTATFSYGGTNYWKMNTDGSVGYTTYYGVVGQDGTVVANAATDNYKKTGNRLQLGLSLLPDGDFSVEYFARYKPIYVYDANEADKIARADDGTLMETDDYMTRAIAYANLQVEHPIIQLGWFTGITSVLDSTSHYWKKENQLQRGSIHWHFDLPDWYYQSSTHQEWHLGGSGKTSHTASAGLNDPTDAWVKNNAINNYGIYVDETVTDNGDSTRTTSAVFSLYRNAKLYDSNASSPNSTANPAGGSHYYDADTAFTADKHNFWLSATHATDFYTVRIYDIALNDEEKQYNYAVDMILYYGIALTDEMWANETYMVRLTERVLKETVASEPLERAAKCAELQAYADALYSDIAKVNEMASFYAKSDHLKAFFTSQAVTSISTAEGTWIDYLGGNVATLGNASKGYWKVREDGAVGYDVIYGEIDDKGYGIYVTDSVYNNYSDYGTRLEFGIDLLPKGDFTVEYLAEYRPVYAAGPDGTPVVEALAYATSLPGLQQYGQTMYAPVDFLGYLASYATERDGVFSGRSYRGEVRWVVHEPVLPSGHWDHAYFTQTLSANADIFQTRNEIRAYGISRVKTTDANSLVTAKYTLFRDTTQYATASFNRKTYEDRIAATVNNEVPYNPPAITDFAKEDTGYFYLSERMSTDFYNVRIYDVALTEDDYARNHLVDLVDFYDVELPEYLKEDAFFNELAALTKNVAFGADPLSYEIGYAELLAAIDTFEAISSENTLYVQDGLVALYTAFVGDDTLISASGNNIVWQNRVLGEKEAVFENVGWTHNSTMGGVGYDLIYGQIDANGAFSSTYAGNTYANKNKLSLDFSLLPKDDYTIEWVARYMPTYCYDARVGELVVAHESGVSAAHAPNKVPSEPIDVIGFMVSYSTRPGGNFTDAGGYGSLRWRTINKAGYKSMWDGGYDFVYRESNHVEAYGLTRDETTTGEGDSLVTTAKFVHYKNLVAAKTIDATSKTSSGAGRYYNYDDDTEFYLSYRQGTTFYALRIYDRVLNEAEKKQNHMADILGYYGIEIPDTFVENEARYSYVLSICETLGFEEDADAYASLKKTLQTAVIGDDKQVTVIAAGNEKTEIAYGTHYPLPRSVEGTNLFAWHKIDEDGNVLASYAPGESVELTDAHTTFRALTLSAPITSYGVSVKVMPEDGFGIRFTSTFDKAEMKAVIAEYGAENIRLSTLIAPQSYVQSAGGFTREKLWNYVSRNGEDASKAFLEIRANGFYRVDEDVCMLAGTIYKFSDTTIKYDPNFAAIGCIDIDTDGDGTFDRTVYGTYAPKTVRKVKKTVESINYMNIQMTDAQRGWVNDFLKRYDEETNGGDKTVAEQRAEIQAAMNLALNTDVHYTVHEFAEGEVKAEYAHIQAISFDGLDSNGKKTRIFAYVGLPEGASAENPVPAMVLVHGGGGHAYMEWVHLWNERGYAAIAMDTTGYFPATPGAWVTDTNAPATNATGRALPEFICNDAGINPDDYVMMPLGDAPHYNRITSSYKEVDEQWQYHGISSVILSHNVLRQNAAIDSSRIGTIGVSWGGTLVSQVIGYDTRFAFAIPVYGTAYLSEPEKAFIGDKYTDALWAAERNLDNFKNPIMWYAWADDNNFGMESYNKSYLHSKKNNSLTTLLVLADWGHSHSKTWNQVHGYAFADSICFGDSPMYATFITEPRGGQNAASRILLPEGATDVSVRIHYLTEPIVYKEFSKYGNKAYSYIAEYWKTDNKSLSIDPATGTITGTVPGNVASYYISVRYTVNGVGLETSSSFIRIR